VCVFVDDWSLVFGLLNFGFACESFGKVVVDLVKSLGLEA